MRAGLKRPDPGPRKIFDDETGRQFWGVTLENASGELEEFPAMKISGACPLQPVLSSRPPLPLLALTKSRSQDLSESSLDLESLAAFLDASSWTCQHLPESWGILPCPSPERLTLKRAGLGNEKILLAHIEKEWVSVEWMPSGPARRLTPEEYDKVSPHSTVNHNISP